MKLEEATALVVDDEADLREIFSCWIGREKCRVLTAANGAQALELLQTEKIDVLLSDIRMPVMDGIALLRTLYERERPVPTVILVSGRGMVGGRELYGLGVEGIVEKPLKRMDLLRVLENSLMDREERWLVPSEAPMAKSLVIEIESLESAIYTSQFRLGRGGCCFSSNCVLDERETILLSIWFAKEELGLDAQGTLRWFDNDTSQAGMSFDYLAPECRGWVIEAMRDKSCRSFIPEGVSVPRCASSEKRAVGARRLPPFAV
jgi:CheY-like chemotaxis protein